MSDTEPLVLQRDANRLVRVWLVWALEDNGGIHLRAVDTSASMARAHRKGLEQEKHIIRVRVEWNYLDHLYGFSIYNVGDRTRTAALDKEGGNR